MASSRVKIILSRAHKDLVRALFELEVPEIAEGIIEAFEPLLGIKCGETTEDMMFTLDEVRCIGCCGLAPVLTVNEDVQGPMTKKKVPELLKDIKNNAQ